MGEIRRPGAFYRAFRYVWRKRTRSILLLLVFLLLFTLMMVGISVERGTEDAAKELRNTFAGYFKLENNAEYAGKKKAITDALVDEISALDGIKCTNRMGILYLYTRNLSLEAGRFTGEGDEKAALACFLGNTNSSLHEYFVLRSMELSEGRHVLADDYKKALISRTLADKNGIEVGDQISAVIEETGDTGRLYTWEVAGIFKINTEPPHHAMTAECDMLSNFIFTDSRSLMEIQTDMDPKNRSKYRAAAFFPEDPEQLDQLLAKVEKMKDYDSSSFQINVNNRAYEQASLPLRRLGGYTRIFLLVLALVSAVLLILILTMWMRDRRKETGIFLSVGIRKKSLFLQYLLEMAMIVLPAAVLSFPVSCLGAGFAGDSILNHIREEAVIQETEKEERYYDPYKIPEPSNAGEAPLPGPVVDADVFLSVLLYGIVTGGLAVSVSSAAVLCMKPGDILQSI